MKRGDSVRDARDLFHDQGSGSIPTSPLQFFFHPCEIDTAISLNRLWHSVLPKVIKTNIIRNKRKACFAAQFDGLYYAAAIWTCPVAANRIRGGA